MTGPTKGTGNSQVSDDTFSGPTGAQSGSGNTQINNYGVRTRSQGGPRRGVWIFAWITTLLLSGVVGFAVGVEPNPEGKPRRILSKDDGVCMEVRYTPVGHTWEPQAWECNINAGQIWTYRNKALRTLDRCLEVKNDAVTMNGCSARVEQEWEWDFNGKIRSLQSKRCLGYEDKGMGEALQVFDCSSVNARDWSQYYGLEYRIQR
jgi:hypothetical protein